MNIIRLRTAVRICFTQLNRLMPINIYYFKYFFFKKGQVFGWYYWYKRRLICSDNILFDST